MHTGPVTEKPEEFGSWHPATCLCRKCGKSNVRVRLWESSDGAFEDYQYKCDDCDETWWVDGIDS